MLEALMYDNSSNPYENFERCMPMMNMPMYGYPMPMLEDDDDDLRKLYPTIYTRMYPIVRHHGDMMESKYGPMYSPTKDEMERICKQICDKYEDYHDDDDDDDDDRNEDEDIRQRRRRRRRRSNEDLIRILLIRDLLGRRRRRHDYGYWY
jgi:hypothetical protein